MSPVIKIYPLFSLFLIFLLVSTVSLASIATSSAIRESFDEYRRIATSLVAVMRPANAPPTGGEHSNPVESLSSDNEFTRKLEEALRSSGVEVVEYWQIASNVFLDASLMERIAEETRSPGGEGGGSSEGLPAIYIFGLDFEVLPSFLKPEIMTGRLPTAEGECAIPEEVYRAMMDAGRHDGMLEMEVPVFLRQPPYVKPVNYSCEIVGVVRWNSFQIQLLEAGSDVGPILLDGRHPPDQFRDSLQYRFLAMVDPDRSEEVLRRANEHPFVRSNNLHVYPLSFFTREEMSSIEEDVNWKSSTLMLIGALSALLVIPLATYLLLRDKIRWFDLMTQMGIPWRSIELRVTSATLMLSLIGVSIGLPSGVFLAELLTELLTRKLGIHVGPAVPELGIVLVSLELIIATALAYTLLEIAGRSHPAKHI